jgi:PAS domain S-box-containing protein
MNAPSHRPPSNHSPVPIRIAPERLADILNIAEDGIVTVTGGQEIVVFNRGAAKIFGYEPTDVIGRSLNLLIPQIYHVAHPGYLDEFARSPDVSRLMNQRKPVFGRRKDGSEFPAEITISKLDQGGETLFTAIVRDITERKRYEEQILRLNQELEDRVRARTAELAERNVQLDQKNKESGQKSRELKVATQQLWQAARLAGVGELAASIAHELNNPLGTVSLRVEGVLAKTPPDDPRRAALEIIDQEVTRMARLVGNLLQFSRAGRDQVSTVDVCDELTRTIELTEHHLTRYGVRVEPDYHPGVPVIFADRQQLRQVFLNLFTNAADAMPTGGRLAVRVRPGALAAGPAAVVEVADTGVGIPPEYLVRVTDPFFTTKEEGKGTGLGLAICKRIVGQHGGRLDIDSTVGRGTTIRITLPVKNDANVAGLGSD